MKWKWKSLAFTICTKKTVSPVGIQTAIKMLFPLDNSCIMCIFCQHVVFACVFQTNENVTKLLTALQDDIANLSEDVSYIARLHLIPYIDILQNLKIVDNGGGDGNESGKTRTEISKATSLHVHHAFCTFLCRRCTTTTWNFLTARFMADVRIRKRFPFRFSEFRYSPLELVTNFWQTELCGMRVIKFKTLRIYFLRDTVAVIVA